MMRYEILSGLTEDDYIAYPEERVKEGMKVTHNYEDIEIDDTADDGSYDDGSMDNGFYDDGSMDDGSYDDGSMDDGFYDDGSSDGSFSDDGSGNIDETGDGGMMDGTEGSVDDIVSPDADGNTEEKF